MSLLADTIAAIAPADHTTVRTVRAMHPTVPVSVANGELQGDWSPARPRAATPTKPAWPCSERTWPSA